MEDNKPDNVDTIAVPRWQTEKICTLADNVVLPKNEGISGGISKIENVEMGTVVGQPDISETTQNNNRKSEHFPIFMIGISIVQIILFYSFDKVSLVNIFGYDPHRRHEIWRFVTVVLVHLNYSHLWENLVVQLILGVFLESVHQWKRIAIIYLASALGGSLFVTLLDNANYYIGASCAVMGLLFAHLATIILNWKEMDRKFTRLFCVLLYIGFTVGMNFYKQIYLMEISNAGHVGHIGGAVTGFLVSILVLKNFEKRPWEKILQKICLGILLLILFIVFVVNVGIREYFPRTEWNFNYKET